MMNGREVLASQIWRIWHLRTTIVSWSWSWSLGWDGIWIPEHESAAPSNTESEDDGGWTGRLQTKLTHVCRHRFLPIHPSLARHLEHSHFDSDLLVIACEYETQSNDLDTVGSGVGKEKGEALGSELSDYQRGRQGTIAGGGNQLIMA